MAGAEVKFDDIAALRKRWDKDQGIAAADVRKLCDVVERIMAKLWPCKAGCFLMATHAKNDIIFGIGQPELCAECARKHAEETGETWIERKPEIPDP
jgi:hypothetical protein